MTHAELYLFCATPRTSLANTWTHAPFQVGQHVYATDGRIMVRVPTEAPPYPVQDEQIRAAETFRQMRITPADVLAELPPYMPRADLEQCEECGQDCPGRPMPTPVALNHGRCFIDLKYLKLLNELPYEITLWIPELPTDEEHNILRPACFASADLSQRLEGFISPMVVTPEQRKSLSMEQWTTFQYPTPKPTP